MSGEFWVGPHTDPDTFQLVSILGGGGEGEVWQAVLPLSAEGRRTVAVKIMPGAGGAEEARNWDRFGHLLRSLSHPGLVRVTDLFTGTGMHRANTRGQGTFLYAVMDHIDGPALREWVVDHPETTVAERLRMLRMIASALDVMHAGTATEIPVAHGDVKPANIVVRPDRSTVLVDLGLARLADGAGVSGHSAPYAAPELRARGALPTPAADRFAFAVTVAQTLTGVPPALGADGWLDVAALDRALRSHPATARRHRLVQQILAVITAPPHGRPPELRRWLDAAVESLSQLTAEPAAGPPESSVPGPTYTGPNATFGGPSVPEPYSDRPHVGPEVGGGRKKRGRDRKRRRAPLLIGAVVVLVGGGGAGVSALYDASPHGSTTAAAPTSVAAAPAIAGIADQPIGAVTETALLTEHDPVQYDTASATGQYRADDATLNGVTYNKALRTTAGCSNDDGGDYWVDYATDRQWNTLTTTVGLSDDSDAETKGTWTLYGDGRPLANGVLALGNATPVSVPVQGVLRLRLHMHDDAATTRGCGSDSKAVMVWGDPTLSR